MVRLLKLETNYLDVDNPWKGVLSATAFAVRSMYHTMLKKTPGQLVFGSDMIFNIQHVASWELIHQNKQKLIDKNNKLENAKQVEHIYKKGSLVLLRRGTENKYKTPYKGPFSILHVNDNRTVSLKVGAAEDMYNIQRLTPYTKVDALDHGGECNMQALPRRSDRV